MSDIQIGQKNTDSPAASGQNSLASGYPYKYAPPPSQPRNYAYPTPNKEAKINQQTDVRVALGDDPDLVQVGGDHYKKMAIQPTEYIIGNGLGFAEGNVIKYVTRHKSKGKADDVRKAIHYLQLILKHEYGTTE